MARYLHGIPFGVELDLYVQPRAAKTRIVGEHGDRLKIQLQAPPVDGEANAALLDFIARLFSVPKRQVELVSGATSRRKRVRVMGIDAAAAEAVMNAGG